MDYVGLDLGKTASQICLLTEDGEVWEPRIKTTREQLRHVFGARQPARILLEASTESEWVACALEELGHEVVVADPNYKAMYAARSRRIKTDRRDARALCEACRQGLYRPAHRTSAGQRERRQLLVTRECLVRSRTRLINTVRALLGAAGWRVVGTGSASFAARAAAVEMSASLRQTLEPLLTTLQTLSAQVAECDERLAAAVGDDSVVRRLMSVPGVGVVTATAFVAALDEVARFATAKQVRAYLGLVPSEESSGERIVRGHITKTGDSRVRHLLVEAAWSLIHSRQEASSGLRQWAERIAQRRGRRIAAVALARKLAGILYALWRDETEFAAGGGQRSMGARRPA